MTTTLSPTIGMRFDLHGSQFEVQFIQGGRVRYAATAGGRQYQISLERFADLQQQGKLQVLSSPTPTFTAEQGPDMVRKHRYVEAIQRELLHPTAPKALRALITRVAATISDSSPPAPSTAILWLRTYQAEGPTGLARKRNRGNQVLRFDPEIERLIAEGIEEIYLKPERGNALDVRCHVIGKLAEAGLCSADGSEIRIPTLRSVQRRIAALDPYVATRARYGDLAANRLLRAAGRAIHAAAPLSIVQMDTHFLDVLVVDPDSGEVLGRPYLTCLMDVCTRSIVGMHISLYPPSAVTALAALKDMLTRPSRGLPGGVPTTIVPDNGIEFKNTAFARVCEVLGIVISPAQVRDPNGKANIERFFYTLTRSLLQKLAGTTFSNPGMRGDYDSSKYACLAMTQLIGLIDQWINGVYHQTVHTRTGRAPLLDWDSQIKLVPPLSLSAEDVDAIARRPVVRTIQRGRVLVDGIEYASHALATLAAQGHSQVTVLVNDLNLHTVLVQHPQDKATLILAQSTDPNYTVDLDCYQHAEAMKLKKSWTQADLKTLGANANALARAELLASVQRESGIGKKRLRQLTNGRGRHTRPAEQLEQMAQSAPALAPPIPASSPLLGPDTKPEATLDTTASTYTVYELE